MKTSLLAVILTLTLGMASTSPTAPHKFEDGFVERTFAIVIRDNLATAEYSIGLNETTLKELLDHWDTPEPSDDLKEKTTEPFIDKGKSSASKTEAPKLDAPTKRLIDSTNSDLAKPFDSSDAPELNPTAQPSKTTGDPQQNHSQSQPSKPNAGSNTDNKPATVILETNQSAGQTDDPENPIHEQLLAALKSSGPAQIAGRIQVTCNGAPLEIKNILAFPAPRHPFNLIVKFEFEIPSVKSAKLHIVDNNFHGKTGAIRYALKALGSTMLVKSSVAPIIIRAKRLELSGLSRKETVSETSISAQLLLMSNSKVGD